MVNGDLDNSDQLNVMYY